ncbi:MAG: hypothetical protein ACR2QC_00720 [Gammaproteobacteria bacterium]
MKIGVLFLTAALALAGCGGGGGGSNAAPDMRTPDTGNTDDMMNTLPGEGARTPQASRDDAVTAQQNLGSVTQSSNVDGNTRTTLDEVRVKLDESGDPMFDEDGSIFVENTREGWESSNNSGYFSELSEGNENSGGGTDGVNVLEGVTCSESGPVLLVCGGALPPVPPGENPPPSPVRIDGTPVIDATDLTLKPPSEYQSGDYYLVTGLWYKDDNDFGVFADGPELTADLPTSGSATYEGGANGIYWDRSRTLIGAQGFQADVTFNAVVQNGGVQISGRAGNVMRHDTAENAAVPILENREVIFNELTYQSPGVAGGTVDCSPGCSVQGGSWGGQFHGNPPAGGETNGWPFSFNGTFGIQGLDYEGDLYDALGTFSTVHGDLDALRTCLTAAGFFHGVLTNGADSCLP